MSIRLPAKNLIIAVVRMEKFTNQNHPIHHRFSSNNNNISFLLSHLYLHNILHYNNHISLLLSHLHLHNILHYSNHISLLLLHNMGLLLSHNI
jgi:hypothetical protein